MLQIIAMNTSASEGTDHERLGQLLAAGHPCISIATFEEDDAMDLVRRLAMDSGLPMSQWSINQGVRDGLLARSGAVADSEHPAAALYHLGQQSRPCIAVMFDIAAHLRDERTLRMLREVIARFRETGGHLVLIDHLDQLPPVIRAQAVCFELSLPDEKELEQILKATLRQRNEQRRVHVELTRRELDVILQTLRGLTRRQARQVVLDAVAVDHRFDIDDIGLILARKRRALEGGGVLEYIESPVSLDQIGGLRSLKRWLNHRQQAMSPSAREFGLPAPRGVLMLGVQGAGKSLAAKAVASAWRWPLLRMDAGSLYDRYIGESERKLRESLHQAERMAPVVLWIDEIEKAFASAASHSNDGGLSRRMFGTMLTWMQERSAAVFLIATANDIGALPPELLRKGRFDEIFFVDLPDEEARRQILGIHLSRRGRDPAGFDLAILASACAGFSGAEIEQAIVSGLHESFAAGTQLSTDLLLAAIRSSPPLSVTAAERITALRAWAAGRCVPAD
jgi:hypothetical protein